MQALYLTLIYLHIFISLFLILVIVLQKTTGNGLFTTSQTNPFMSGAQITQFVTKLTSFLIVIFFINTLILAKISFLQNKKDVTLLEEVPQMEPQVPVLE